MSSPPTADEPTVAVADPEVAPGASPGRPRRMHPVLEWLVVLVVAVGVSLLIRAYAFQTYYIPSGSMEPTLHIGDRIIVSKLSVEFGTIHIGDVVVFRAPPAVKAQCGDAVPDLVKRVIGLPGDHLTSRGNAIYVNGQRLKQWWTHNPILGRPIGSVTVPANHYFMLGDNEANSCDSRYWGTVPRSDIVGKAIVRIWPLSRVGFL
ncbi:MAG TPA: signal peptidase I [Acidimicrobiales bacterium]|nr:signal peptidase I [Acidimicrobiales bacterium]